ARAVPGAGREGHRPGRGSDQACATGGLRRAGCDPHGAYVIANDVDTTRAAVRPASIERDACPITSAAQGEEGRDAAADREGTRGGRAGAARREPAGALLLVAPARPGDLAD